jgi:hypothetical protein
LGGVVTATAILTFQWFFPADFVAKANLESSPPELAKPVLSQEPRLDESQAVPAAFEPPPQIPAKTLDYDPEWGPVIMDALKPRYEGNPNKNQRLIQIAVVEAQGVPSVQETCLRHLTFSLSNEEAGELYKLAVNQSLPLSGRRYLVDKSLRIRSPEVAGWMAGQLVRHPEPEIAKLASRYLERQQRKAAAAAAAAQGGEAAATESSGPF